MFDDLHSVLPVTAACAPDGAVSIGGVTLTDCAQAFGTPLVVYDEQHISSRVEAYKQAFSQYPGSYRMAFACKSMCLSGILSIMYEHGVGADVASAGECAVALASGIDPEMIVMHGNAKSRDEIAMAVNRGIGLIVVDTIDEFDRIIEYASTAGITQKILVRVTPDIETETHQYIRTAHSGSKFGVTPDEALALLVRAATTDAIDARGIHIHLGSQLLDLAPWNLLVDWIGEFAGQCAESGVTISTLNIGGGLGIAYTEQQEPPTVEYFSGVVVESLQRVWPESAGELPELIIEPGRSIVGSAAVTVYRVESTKQAGEISYAMVDGGMSDNIRPMLYQAEYRALDIRRGRATETQKYWIAGKHCESGDVLIEDAELPLLSAGDNIAICSTGAYTMSMASNYNMIPRPAIIGVRDGTVRLLSRRETIEDVLSRDVGIMHDEDVLQARPHMAAPRLLPVDAIEVVTDIVARIRPDMSRTVIAAATGAVALRLPTTETVDSGALSEQVLAMLESRHMALPDESAT